MRRTAKTYAEWNKRFSRNRVPVGEEMPAHIAIARFKTDYPHLMKRVPVRVGKMPPGVRGYQTPTNLQSKLGLNDLTMGRAEMHKHLMEKFGHQLETDPVGTTKRLKGWLKQKARPEIVLGPGKYTDPQYRSTFVLAHEMRHAADSLKRTNRQSLTHALLGLAVPYDMRPTEWRANIAGVKKVVREFNMSPKEAMALKKEIFLPHIVGSGLALGKLAVVPAAVAAAIAYKRHLAKKKTAAVA
jgi:hypothetical protein